MPHHKHSRHKHRDICGQRSSFHPQTKAEEEYRSENHIQTCADKIGPHRLLGIARRAHHVVEIERQIDKHQSRDYPQHKLASVRQRLVRRSESPEDRVEENGEETHVDQPDDDGQCQRVAQDSLGTRLVVLPHDDRDACRRTCADEHAQSSRNVHHRERDGNPTDDIRVVDGMADNDTVDDMI